MSLNLIYGASKTGKTEYLLNILSDLKDTSAVMIVPEQISLSCENKIIEKSGYLSSDRDVLSFGRLFYRVYKEFSYKKREYISNCGKAVIINKILHELKNELLVFGNEKRMYCYTEPILSTISEFKRYGLSPKDIKSCAELSESKSTKAKLSDLSTIYESYDKKIELSGSNSEDNSKMLIKLIPESKFVKSSVFLIDGFSSFTKTEREIIRLLCKFSKDVYITLKTDRENTYLFAETEKTAALLKKDAENIKISEVTLTGNKVHKDDLLFLAENYGYFKNKTFDKKCENIFLYTSDSVSDEINLCSRDILKYIRNGYRFSDIAIASGALSEHLPIIKKAFTEHSIRYYADTKHGILNHPMTVLFTALFDIHLKNFAYEDVFRFLKTGYSDFSHNEICVLENYVLKFGIKGKKWLDDFKYTYDGADLETINNLRKAFINTVMPFKLQTKGRTKISSYLDAIKEFICDIKLTDKTETMSLELLENGKKEEASELRAVFNSIIGTFKEIILATDDSSVSLENFKDLFISGVSQIKAGIIPPTSDSVFVCDIENIRNRQFKIIYIINANEGVFPQKISGTGIITDKERQFMESNNFEIAPDNKEKTIGQPFKIYETLTSSSDKLIISRSLTDVSGKSTLPSPVISSIKELFPFVSCNNFNSKDEKDYLSTPKATLMQLLINKQVDFSKTSEWYLSNPLWREKYLKIIQDKEFVISAKINEQINALMWGKQLNATVSRLEAFARCPYSFLLKYGLNLKKRQEKQVESSDTGTFVHKIMEDSISKIINSNISFEDINKSVAMEISEKTAENAIAELKIKYPEFSAKDDFLIRRLKKAGTDAILAVAHHISAGDFIPYKTELSFENGSEIAPPMEYITPKGNKVKLYGKIDRVDKSESGFRIIDYKSSTKDLELGKVYEGISLQLFAYASALKDKLGNPNGMFYFIFKPAIAEKNDIAQQNVEPEILKNYKMSGYTIGTEDTVLSMDKNMENYSDVISARMTKSGISTSKLMSYDAFSKLSEKLKEKIGIYSDDILDGKFDITPLVTATQHACDYCDFKSICRYEEQYFNCRRYYKISDEEVMEKLNGKEHE